MSQVAEQGQLVQYAVYIAHKDIFGTGKNGSAQRLAASQSTSNLCLLQAVAEGIWVWMTPSGNSCRRCELSRNVKLFWQCRTSWQASTRHARMLPRSTTQPFRPEPTLLDSSRLQRLWSPRACDLVTALYVISTAIGVLLCCWAVQMHSKSAQALYQVQDVYS